jgi:hypothetical protein
MSKSTNEALAEADRVIERLRLENSKLNEDWLELAYDLLPYTGLPGQMQSKKMSKECASTESPRVAALIRNSLVLEYAPGRPRTCNPMIRSVRFNIWARCPVSMQMADPEKG